MVARSPSENPGITSLYAFIVLPTPDDPKAGVAAFYQDGKWWPMVGADMERIDSLRPLAQRMATSTKRTVVLRLFSAYEDVERIEP